MAAIACAGALLLTGARPGERPGTPRPDASPAAAGTVAPRGDQADRAHLFGLVAAGETPDTVLFAPARKVQPGGPETVRPADVGPYIPLRLAPGAVIRASAPIANDGVTDWVRGIRLTREEFHTLLVKLQQRSHPLLERAHMFEVWFDGRGRVIRMQHYFSP
jgi:hypothetical protein